MDSDRADSTQANPVAQAESVPQWLLKGARPKVNAAVTAPTAVPSLRSEAGGRLVDQVTAFAQRIAPTGSKRLSAEQYPDLQAATAKFGTGAVQLTVTVQQLQAPIYLTDLTMGFPEDVYQEWPNGVQVVTVRHAMPDTFQVIAVRGKGVQLTVSVTASTAEEKKPDLLAPWAGADQFVQRFRDVASDTAVDAFAAE